MFSIVFGEGIVNDAVAMILFQTMTEFVTDDNPHFDASTFFGIVGSFLLLGVVSILIGLAIGLLASYIFKRMRFLSVSAIKETLLIFCFGYVAYTFADLIHMSGIIAMLTSGVTMAHYAWYSLSPQGKHVSSVTFQVLGFLAESFVFVYLGLSFFFYAKLEWSWQFIIIEFFIIIVGRFFGTVVMIQFLRLFGHKAQVTLR